MDRWSIKSPRVGVGGSMHDSPKEGRHQNATPPPHLVVTFCEIPFLSLLCWAPGPDFSSSPGGEHHPPEPAAT